MVELKKKILHSLYEEESADESQDDDKQKEKSGHEKASKKKNKNKSKAPENGEVGGEKPAESTKIEDTTGKDAGTTAKQSKQKKPKKKKKNKNIIESMTDERLAAYGIDPKKMKKKLKYSQKQKQ